MQSTKQSGNVSDVERGVPLFQWYIYISAAMLGVAGILMLVSAGERLKVMQQPDALLGFTTRTVLVLVGLLHLVASVCVFAVRGLMNQAIVLLWLGLNCLVYRVGLAWMHVANPPPAVKALGLKFGIKAASLDTCWKWFIAWLALGSLVVLTCEWRRLKRLEAESFMKRYREKRKHEEAHTLSPTK
jgi:hypothetical protein